MWQDKVCIPNLECTSKVDRIRLLQHFEAPINSKLSPRGGPGSRVFSSRQKSLAGDVMNEDSAVRKKRLLGGAAIHNYGSIVRAGWLLAR